MNVRILLIFALLSTAFAGKGQNLVPNGDFEQYSGCPSGAGPIDSALFWMNPQLWPGNGGSPDYLNQCANAVPGNVFGYQQAHSGVAYCGLALFGDFDFREYIEVPLTSTLNANSCYHFEMYFNLGENYSEYVTSNVEAYFSDTAITGINSNLPLPFIPQLNNTTGNYPDTANWTLVSGNYTASGGENYLLIGNFKNNLNSDTILYNGTIGFGYSYVFIDDVSLTPCTGIEEHNNNEAFSIYPNPAKDQLFIKSNSLAGKAEIIVTDILGKEIYHNQFLTSDFRLPTSNFKEGIYFLEINNGKEIFRKKFLKE